jgi:hypothetical protein
MFASLDQVAVHDRDLARGPAEVDEAELEPVAEGAPEVDRGLHRGRSGSRQPAKSSRRPAPVASARL